MQACHNNGQPGDPALSNLRWDTPEGNMRDQYLHGTRMRAIRHPHERSRIVPLR
jgi:hypothetical protein